MASRTSAKVTYPEHLQEVELRPSRNTVADDRDTKIALPLSERLRNNLRKRSFEEANLPSLLKERRRKSRISSDSRSGLQENEESDQHASKCAESIIEEHTKQSSQPPETCCFKSCSESIIYGDHSRTEVQTILPSNGLLKNSSPNIR